MGIDVSSRCIFLHSRSTSYRCEQYRWSCAFKCSQSNTSNVTTCHHGSTAHLHCLRQHTLFALYAFGKGACTLAWKECTPLHLQISDDDKGKDVATSLDRTKPEGMRCTQRIIDEVTAVLFDGRRQSCHGLVLNRFIVFSGLKELLKAFQTACHTLFAIMADADAEPMVGTIEAKSTGTAATLPWVSSKCMQHALCKCAVLFLHVCLVDAQANASM